MLSSKNINLSRLFRLYFQLIIVLSFFQSAYGAKFEFCGDPRHSWNPIDGAVTLDLAHRTVTLRVTGVANDTLYGASTQTQGRIATSLYIVSTLNSKGSVTDSNLCPSLGGCPTKPGNITLNKILELPNYAPFVDIHIMAILIDENGGEYGCFATTMSQTDETYNDTIATVVLWTLVLPILTMLCGYFFGCVRDVFTYTSNFEIDGRMQSLRYPGIFKVIYHLQFVVATALLNLDYSLFHQKFVFRFHSTMGILADSITSYGSIKAPGASSSTHLPSPLTTDDHGIAFFSHFVDLQPDELLVSLLIVMSFAMLAVLLASGIINGVAILVMKSDGANYSQKKLFAFTLGNILRVLILFHFPLTLFSFNQLMIHDSVWLTIIAAALVAFLSLGVIAGIMVYLMNISPTSIIFIDTFHMLRSGPLYNDYTPASYQYSWIHFSYRITLAGIVVFGKSNGLIQLILMLCLEFAMFYACVGIHPYVSKSVNRWEITFQAMRIAMVALLFAYLPAVKAGGNAKDWCGLISIFFILVAQLVWTLRGIVCFIMIIKAKYIKPENINDVLPSATPGLLSQSQVTQNRVSAPTSVVGTTITARPSSSKCGYDSSFNDKSWGNRVSHTSLPDRANLSPYDLYIVSLRENAGLRQEILIDNTTDTRSSTNLSTSTFSPRLAYTSYHSQPSRSSVGYDDPLPASYPQDSSSTLRQSDNLPKFFSANNE
ncbi:hypothetical protein K7432_003862 [Basidiobolus ranarum]|uniref:Phosphatidylglycerol/phosphatidylinositol transfer protein n=1 Tax=Basidiobolus ranarum TaxID=34480 RepID=A0ABR2WZ56_9FUNG